MNNVERFLFALVLVVGGVAAGMAYEHQRFLKEIQGLSSKHKETKTPPDPTTPTPTPEAVA